jgi:putative flippase GtrA
MKRGLREIFWFMLIGGIGFVVDGGVLSWLVSQLHWDIYLSRGISFPAATLITWLLNRSLTFGQSRKGMTVQEKSREYGRYFLVQSVGSAVNLTTFAVLIFAFPAIKMTPIVPLAAGSIVALFFNFAGSKRYVHRRNLPRAVQEQPVGKAGAA